ncbi:MAG: hypothetical protein LBE56_14980 [Tannerella sp.]|nr:hypothetical protein [Tannerella sp.]
MYQFFLELKSCQLSIIISIFAPKCIEKRMDMKQVAGIKVERADNGVPKSVIIDLFLHADIIPFLIEKGVEIEEPIQWTAKMKRSLAQAERGEWVKGDFNNFWNI